MAWLSGWGKRIKLTIDSSKIDSNLSHFPVAVVLSSTHGDCVFDELGSDANRFKIAFTKADGTTQLYGDIELWDDANEKAVIHVSGSGWSISSSADTDFYMYYDSEHGDNTSYIGDTGDTAAQSVWDSNFEQVLHMQDETTTTIADATSQENDGTKTSEGNPIEVDGQIGKAQDFSSDNISYTISGDVTYVTIETLLKPDNITSGQYISDNGGNRMAPIVGYQSGYYNIYGGGYPTGSASDSQIEATGVGSWDLLTWVREDDTIKGYLNGSLVVNVSISAGNFALGTNGVIGKAGSGSNYFDGTICERRLSIGSSSAAGRSAAWIKATYNTLFDSLLTYGSEEEEETGDTVTCPSPFTFETSLQGNITIAFVPGVLSGQNGIQANVEVSLSISPLTVQGELHAVIPGAGDTVALTEPLSLETSLAAALKIGISPPPLTADGSIVGVPGVAIAISAGALSVESRLFGTPVEPLSLTGSNRVYIFTLTGDADGLDDIVIPIKSFQSRIRSGDPTYLSVVIPGTDYLADIYTRGNGDLIVRMGYKKDGEVLISETIARVEMEKVRYDKGGTNKSVTLSGYRTETYEAKTVDLHEVTYSSLNDGTFRVRCNPDLYVRPGDHVYTDDEDFDVSLITYSVTPGQELFEVAGV